ncbi:MAG: nuclear transport factor 2 family protein [Thermoplasmata archaeon]
MPFLPAAVGVIKVVAYGSQIPVGSVVITANPTRINIEAAVSAIMSPNKKLVETYLTTSDKPKRGPLLADDVEWVEWVDGVPSSGAITRGKEAYLKNYGDNELRGEVHRLTEENNVVVAEGTAHVTKKDGSSFSVRFVDIFELENGKIKRKSSFGALVKDPPEGTSR